jgi:DNA-directed RNA polymerase specialized sigma24 family protein
MVEAKHEVGRAEFEAVTRRLVARAETGRGRVTAVPTPDAEDVVQEAWEKRLRQSDPLPDGRQLEAHIHEALVDTSFDYWRSRRRRKDVPPDQLIPLEDAAGQLPRAADTEEARIAAVRARQIYEAALRIVGPETAAYAVLDALDLDEKEIARKLEISEREAGRLRKRVTRARSALANAISHHSSSTKEDH